MRRFYLAFLAFCLFVVFMASPFNGLAQPGDPPSGDPDTVPITGIEILLGLGSLFGAKKIFDSKKKIKID